MILLALQAALAEPVAQAILVEGSVFVGSGADQRALGRFDPLESTDTIVTGEDGAVILQLFNDHLVRVDSELELPLNKVVLLTAPRRPVADVAGQLAVLLYLDESERFGGMVSETESIGGWHARITASRGEAGGGNPKQARRPAASEALVPRYASGSASPRDDAELDAPAAAAAPPPPPAEGPPPLQLQGQLPDSAPLPKIEPRLLADVFAPFQVGGDAFATCTLPWIQGLGIEKRLKSVVFQVRLEDGAVHRITNDAQLPVPPCMRDAVLGAPVTGSDPIELQLR